MQPTEETTATDSQRLIAAGKQIEAYRADGNLSKVALLKRYPELGTDRTYSRVIAGDAAELNPAKWLASYESVLEAIREGVVERGETLIEGLSGPQELCTSFIKHRQTRTNRRFILVLGDSGVGKTSSVRVLLGKGYGSTALFVEATDLWRSARGTAAPLLEAIARALKLSVSSRRVALLDDVVLALKARSRCLIVDEAHHLDPTGINVLKTLINLTPTVIIATAMPYLWDKLASSRSGWVECKQLTGNRLAQVIRLTLSARDVKTYLAANLAESLTAEEIDKATKELLPTAKSMGNMSFVAACVETYLEAVNDGEKDGYQTWINAVHTEAKSR